MTVCKRFGFAFAAGRVCDCDDKAAAEACVCRNLHQPLATMDLPLLESVTECTDELDEVKACYSDNNVALQEMGDCNKCLTYSGLVGPFPANCLASTSEICSRVDECNSCGECQPKAQKWAECIVHRVLNCNQRLQPCDCIRNRDELNICTRRYGLDPEGCRSCINDNVPPLQGSCRDAVADACSSAPRACRDECGPCMEEAREWMQYCPGGGLGRCRPFMCPPIDDEEGMPTMAPWTLAPTVQPTSVPTVAPVETFAPTLVPSAQPSAAPVTAKPSLSSSTSECTDEETILDNCLFSQVALAPADRCRACWKNQGCQSSDQCPSDLNTCADCGPCTQAAQDYFTCLEEEVGDCSQAINCSDSSTPTAMPSATRRSPIPTAPSQLPVSQPTTGNSTRKSDSFSTGAIAGLVVVVSLLLVVMALLWWRQRSKRKRQQEELKASLVAPWSSPPPPTTSAMGVFEEVYVESSDGESGSFVVDDEHEHNMVSTDDAFIVVDGSQPDVVSTSSSGTSSPSASNEDSDEPTFSVEHGNTGDVESSFVSEDSATNKKESVDRNMENEAFVSDSKEEGAFSAGQPAIETIPEESEYEIPIKREVLTEPSIFDEEPISTAATTTVLHSNQEGHTDAKTSSNPSVDSNTKTLDV